ncbi:MAG: alpha-galactosidase [Saprospiraceae bacterium]|nr:alpha-galactosidase [Saprospiraceae bacterium]MCB9319030.1 alpha-galactosidase [Lewinellaceae bacterium]
MNLLPGRIGKDGLPTSKVRAFSTQLIIWLIIFGNTAGGYGQMRPVLAEQLPAEKTYSPTDPDWLLDPSPYKTVLCQDTSMVQTIVLSNGLIRRAFLLGPDVATIALDQIPSNTALLRGIYPEAAVTINGEVYQAGGLTGQPNYAYLDEQWLKDLKPWQQKIKLRSIDSGPVQPSMAWKQVRHHAANVSWPPPGIHLQMVYVPTDQSIPQFELTIHYEMYDGLPVICKWITLVNKDAENLALNHFTSEMLALVEYGSRVDNRAYETPHPNLHVETDFAFGGMMDDDANHHVVHWDTDSLYSTQVNYLRQNKCFLRVSPEIGPEQSLWPADTFTSHRTYLLAYDGYDRERNGLAQRRMYRTIAPWTTENPLMMHVRFADWTRVKAAIDQCADVGFEMVILSFGSGFNIEDTRPVYLDSMQMYAQYARSKGLEIGGYSLLASRSISPEDDVRLPEGQTPVFGHSPCLESRWGLDYFTQLYRFYTQSGFSLLEHDGSYPGDPCMSTTHPGHQGFADSRWNQFQTISSFYKWCRGQGIYLNIPDYYFMSGGNKCGMGYREVNWSLPREQQVIHTRQNIYDGTWSKLSTMGWMFVPLTEYQGGGAQATIEPLHEHLDHYQNMMISNLGAGVQACYRGPRLYDTEETRTMVKNAVSWFKQHREVLEGDLLHLRRADDRDIDYWLMVNPASHDKAALMVFNPLPHAVRKTIRIPLYYTGLSTTTQCYSNTQMVGSLTLDRDYQVDLTVEVPANGWRAYFFTE